MNRRSFFAHIGAAIAAPKAVKLLPPAESAPFLGIDRTFATSRIELTGLAGWLPTEPLRFALPRTPAGRLEAAADLFEDGIIDRETFAAMTEEYGA